MSTDKKQTEEEVDLGPLFVIIGKGFSNFFHFLGKTFKVLFHIFILVLLFIKKRFLKLAIAFVIGLGIGFFLEKEKEEVFTSHLVVHPNFGSTGQLYTNINYYNELVKQGNIEELEKLFNISEAEASSLKGFEIEAIENLSDIVESYNRLFTSVDSSFYKNYSYKEFAKNFSKVKYQNHLIYVFASEGDVFPKLKSTIINSISENKYFSRFKELSNRNLNRADSILKNNLKQVDSLRTTYIKVMIEESKKEFKGGTSIDLGNRDASIVNNREIELFNIDNRINSDLIEIGEKKAKQFEIINVIIDFKPGYVVKSVEDTYIFIFPLLFVSILLIFVLLKDLNSFLEKYKSK